MAGWAFLSQAPVLGQRALPPEAVSLSAHFRVVAESFRWVLAFPQGFHSSEPAVDSPVEVVAFESAEVLVYLLEFHLPAPLVGFGEPGVRHGWPEQSHLCALAAGSRARAARWRVPLVARQESGVQRELEMHSACSAEPLALPLTAALADLPLGPICRLAAL